jgi:hypothetical protein
MDEPMYLKTRGLAIWRSYQAGSLPAGEQALIHELARLADALDKLDMILGARASDWAKIVIDEVGEVTLEVNGLLGERRQHAIAFKTLFAEIRAAGIKPVEGSVPVGGVAPPEDMLAKRKREKEERERQLG